MLYVVKAQGYGSPVQLRPSPQIYGYVLFGMHVTTQEFGVLAGVGCCLLRSHESHLKKGCLELVWGWRYIIAVHDSLNQVLQKVLPRQSYNCKI